jgi:selenocysteine lyase/cysteine desulfurase
MEKWACQAVTQGDTVWPEWSQTVESLRVLAAELIHAEPREIALVPSTTYGINIVAEGISWNSGDNVVTLDNEFPSNAYPWLNCARRGVEVRRVPTDRGLPDPQRLAAAIDPRTRVVSVSWVGFAGGCRQDLAAITEMAHAQGAWMLVDAIQGLGIFPLDVREIPIDFLAADGHKWLLGPEGAGIAYIRHACLEALIPHGIGWNSVVRPYDFDRVELDLKPTAGRFEGGSQNMAGMIGLEASLRLLMECRTPNVAAAILQITDQACERLQSLGARVVSRRTAPQKSGIVSFEMPGKDHDEVRAHCLAQHVALSHRGGCLRISPHAYNSDEDLDRLIAALQSC